MKLKKILLASGAFGGMTVNERRLGRFIRDGEGHPAPTPTPEPTPTPAPEPTADDAFAAAFAEHAADTPAPTPTPAPVGAPPADEPAAGADSGAADKAPAGEAPAGEPPAATPSGDAVVPPAEAKPEALTPEQILENLAKLVKPGETPAPTPTPTPAATPEPQPAYTAEEQGILAEYTKNWPDVERAETLKRRGEYQDLLGFVFAEVGKLVQPLYEQQRTIGNTLHMSELKGLVPDYTESLETQVASWVDTQPSYLQTAYKQVMQSGTSDEIADLIGRYRSATGTPAPTPTPTPAPAGTAAAPAAAAPKPAAKTELSSAAKQAAESLAPVSGDRSAVPQGEDTQDYDSAFAKYAAAEKV